MRKIYLSELDPDRFGIDISCYHDENNLIAQELEGLQEFKYFRVDYVTGGLIHIVNESEDDLSGSDKARISLDGSIIIAQNLTQIEF
jgi:hypothetical protein